MDWNHQPPNTPNYNGQQPYVPWSYDPSQQQGRRANGFAVASLILGILAVLTICTVYLPWIFGSLSILFALLSKGKETHMHSLAYSGTVVSFIALVISVLFISFVFSALVHDELFQQEFNAAYESIYGESFEEQWNEIWNNYE